MTWRRTVIVLGFIAAGLCIYRLALLIAISAKLFGYAYPFDFWSGPITRSTIEISKIPTDLYLSRRSRNPLVIVHGVNETGKDSADLRRMAEALTGSGYKVFVPDFVRLRHQNVTPRDVQDVQAVIDSVGSDSTLVCVSYGCGPALIAATLPQTRDRVKFILTYGAYFDLTETLGFIVTAPESAFSYSKWLYMSANLDLLDNEAERSALRAIAIERQHISPEEWRLDYDRPGTPGDSMLKLFESTNLEEFGDRLASVPRLRDRIQRLSPSRYFEGMRARLLMVHMASDPAIPSSQSARMSEAAASQGIPYTLILFNLYGHTTPDLPERSLGHLLRVYLPEGLRMIRLVNQVLNV